jgi:hypothetical protein
MVKLINSSDKKQIPKNKFQKTNSLNNKQQTKNNKQKTTNKKQQTQKHDTFKSRR